jgi:hypothetical protein
MCGKDDVVGTDVSAQELRHLTVKAQNKLGQNPRVILKQAVCSDAWTDGVQFAVEIAPRVEHGEEVVMLEHMKNTPRRHCVLDEPY